MQALMRIALAAGTGELSPTEAANRASVTADSAGALSQATGGKPVNKGTRSSGQAQSSNWTPAAVSARKDDRAIEKDAKSEKGGRL